MVNKGRFEIKNKGISLIVLIITIVVILVLATAIIVNIAKTNLINNATEAVFKQDVGTFQDSLKLYHNDRYIETSGEYNPNLLNADYNGTYYNGELLDISIYDILPGLRDSKLDGIAYIKDGKLVLDGNSLTDNEKDWSEDTGITISGKPIVKNVSVQAGKTQINVNVEVSEISKISKYKYRINEEEWVETTQSTYTFENLQVTTKYKISVIVVSESGDESDLYEEELYTLGNEEDLQIVPETNNYVAEILRVQINYASDIPEGYKLQYRLTKENGTIIEQDWISYDSNVGIILNENMIITARIYKSSTEDELLSTSKQISTVDTEAPTKPTSVELTFGTNSVTATANGSTDVGSGLQKYQYSIDNSTWQDSGTFSNIKSGTSVTIYARAVDKVGRISEVVSSNGSTTSVTGPTLSVTLENPVNDWTKTKAIVTLTGTAPSGYELQYKLTNLSGTVTQNWTKYTGQLNITENNVTISGRYYNASADDEIVSSPASKTTSNIDLSNPTKPTAVNLTFGTNSVTAVASGSTDVGSGIQKYQYSKDNSTWQDSGTFSGIKSGTAVTIYARAVDKVGRVSESTSSNGSTTTITGPTLNVTLENPVNGWTSTKAIATLSGTTPEGYELQYKLGTGAWIKYTSQVSIIENNVTITGRYYNASADDEIVSSPASKTTSNIDLSNPSKPIAVKLTFGTNSVTAVASGSTDVGSGIAKYEYSKDGKSWQDSGTFSNIKSGTSVTIYARAVDKVGRISETTSSNGAITSITGPTLNVTLENPTNGWTKTKAIATLSGTAPEGYELQYKLGTGAWTKYTGQINITENNVTVSGRYYNASADDEIVSSPASKTTSNIDLSNPNKPTKVDLTFGTNSVTATASGSTDVGSGIAKYEYSKDGKSWQDSGTFSNIKSGTSVTIYARAIDKVGRISEVTTSNGSTTSITGPTLNVTLENPVNGWTSTKAIATLTGTAPTGYELQYKKGTGAWTKYTGQINLTENNVTISGRYYNASADDEIVSSPASKTTSNIDLSNPSKPTKVDLTFGTNSVTAVASGSTDVGSGIQKYQYSKDNSTWQDSGTFSGYKSGTSVTIYARAVDKVGRISEATSSKGTTTKVTAPTLSVKLENPVLIGETYWTKTKAIATLTGTVPEGYELQYKIGTGAWTKYTGQVNITENGKTIAARCYNATLDDEIISSPSSVTVSTIDNGNPTNGTVTVNSKTVLATVVNETITDSSRSDFYYYIVLPANATIKFTIGIQGGCTGQTGYIYTTNTGNTYTSPTNNSGYEATYTYTTPEAGMLKMYSNTSSWGGRHIFSISSVSVNGEVYTVQTADNVNVIAPSNGLSMGTQSSADAGKKYNNFFVAEAGGSITLNGYFAGSAGTRYCYFRDNTTSSNTSGSFPQVFDFLAKGNGTSNLYALSGTVPSGGFAWQIAGSTSNYLSTKPYCYKVTFTPGTDSKTSSTTTVTTSRETFEVTQSMTKYLPVGETLTITTKDAVGNTTTQTKTLQ